MHTIVHLHVVRNPVLVIANVQRIHVSRAKAVESKSHQVMLKYKRQKKFMDRMKERGKLGGKYVIRNKDANKYKHKASLQLN